MFKFLLALHLLAAVFAVGPLVHAATTAGRALRQGDAAAAASSARTVRVYSYASIVVVVLGFGLMSAKPPFGNSDHVAEFADTWIWLSVLLWLVSIGLTLGMLAPSLQQAGGGGDAATARSGLTARVAAVGGSVGLLYAAIIFLMVYRPGG